MTKESKTVDKIIQRQIKKNSKQIENALIEPLSEQYPFSTNGIYFLCARMGCGKTYFIMKHIMITERLFNKPYYDSIIFTSTSGQLDKTATTLQKEIKTDITYVPHEELLPYIQKHIRNKMKFYSVMEYINKKEVNDIFKKILEKYKMFKWMKGKKIIDVKRVIMYAQAKMKKYGFTNYPTYTLLVLDDFATNPLIKKVDSELVGMLTKTRHYHLTCIVVAQTWRFIQLNLKRLCTDVVIWKGYSMEDFQKMITQTPSSLNWKDLWGQYSQLQDKHSKLIIHCNTNEYCFDE